MKTIIAITVVGFACGVWAGMNAGASTSALSRFDLNIVIASGALCLLLLVVAFRAKPGSGDSMVAPGMALVAASQLVSHLPPLLWPTSDGLRMAGSAVGIIVPVTLLVLQFRRRRQTARAKHSAG